MSTCCMQNVQQQFWYTCKHSKDRIKLAYKQNITWALAKKRNVTNENGPKLRTPYDSKAYAIRARFDDDVVTMPSSKMDFNHFSATFLACLCSLNTDFPGS